MGELHRIGNWERMQQIMATQTQKPKSLRYWIGLVLILFGMNCFLLAPVVPLLGLSSWLTATLIGLLIVGIPEVFLIAGGLLAGRELVEQVRAHSKRLFRYLGLSGPVGPTRHYIGVGLIGLGICWALALDYLFLVELAPLENSTKLYLLLAGDSLILVGLLVAGRPFWVKLKRLFVWTPEEAAAPTPTEQPAIVPPPALETMPDTELPREMEHEDGEEGPHQPGHEPAEERVSVEV
jgi:hypothetical protein